MQEFVARLLTAWVEQARRFAVPVLVAAVLSAGGALVYTYAYLEINSDAHAMLADDLPARQRMAEFAAEFPQVANMLVVVVEGDNPDRVAAAAADLARRLGKRTDAFNTIFDPANDPVLISSGLMFRDADALQDLLDRLSLAQPLLAGLARDPSLRGLLAMLGEFADGIAKDLADGGEADAIFTALSEVLEAQAAGRRRSLSWKRLMAGMDSDAARRRLLILTEPRIDHGSLDPGALALAAARQAIADSPAIADGGVTVRLTGSVILGLEEVQSAMREVAVAGLVSFVLVAILLGFALRSGRLVVGTLVTLALGLCWTAAFTTFAIGHLNLISIAFVVLFVGLGVDFGIHFALRYREELDAGSDNAEALRRTVAGVGGALAMCAVAAATCFYSFIPTAYKGVSELGLISGTGMAIALFANLTVLPAWLALFPAAPRRATAGVPVLVRAGSFLAAHPRVIIAVAALCALAAAASLPMLRFEIDPLRLKDPTTESVRTLMDLLADRNAPTYTISVVADDLESARRLAVRLEALEVVERALTLDDYLPENQPEKIALIADTALTILPSLSAGEPPPPPNAGERRAAMAAFERQLEQLLAAPGGRDRSSARRLAAALAAFERRFGGADSATGELATRLLASLPAQLDLLRRSLAPKIVEREDLPPELVARMISAEGRARIEVYAAEDIGNDAGLRRFVGKVRVVAPDATDAPVMIVEAGAAISVAIRDAVITSAVIIGVFLLLVLRSPRHTVLMLLPLALAGGLTVLVSVLLDKPFNFANVIVVPLLLGLGIASGIHMVMRQRYGGGDTELLRTSTPKAVLFSALTTIASFGTLAFSNHRGLASMGELLAIAIGLTLICTLTVLPALLAVAGRNKVR